MTQFVAAGAGFLLAVLWFDLMFDVQVLRVRPDEIPEPVLASIAAYYRRVTTAARPMNRLVAAAIDSVGFAFTSQKQPCQVFDGPLGAYVRKELELKGLHVS